MRLKKTTGKLILAAALVTLIMALSSNAASFPAKNLTFLIGTSPGGSNDLACRALIPGLESALGVKVVPEMLSGANGAVAAVKLGSLKPDGYTIYLHSQSLVMMQYTGQPQVNIKKYQPIAQVAEDIAALAVPIDAPYNSLKEFIDYAKRNPNKIRISVSSIGNIWHIAGILFTEKAGIKVDFIPYEIGGTAAITAVASKEVEATVTSPGEQRPLVEAKKIKILAVFGDQRHPLFPNVPTAQEVGLDVVYPVWRGVFTTAGVPEDALKILEAALKAASESKDFKTFMETAGFPVRFKGTAEFTKLVQEQDLLHKRLLEQLGIKTTDPI